MLFQQSLIKNSRAGKDQYKEVWEARRQSNAQESLFSANQRAHGLRVNQGLIPEDVYRDFDNTTVEVMRLDDGEVFLQRLMDNSRSINLGKLVSDYRQASDAGLSQTSMTGQTSIKLDQVEYVYDGTLVPIQDNGFKRNFREWEAVRSENFDPLLDDQRETMIDLRIHISTSFLDGHRNEKGDLIVVDGKSWQGMRGDPRVAQVDLGPLGLNIDFSSNALTPEQIKIAFIQLRDVLYNDNKYRADVDYYISTEIASNWERKFSTNYNAPTLDAELGGLRGVGSIDDTSLLVGNQIMAFPRRTPRVQALVGMGLNTVAMPRATYNSDYKFANWGAIGFQIKPDYFGNTTAMYASEIS